MQILLKPSKFEIAYQYCKPFWLIGGGGVIISMISKMDFVYCA